MSEIKKELQLHPVLQKYEQRKYAKGTLDLQKFINIKKIKSSISYFGKFHKPISKSNGI